MKRLPPDPSIRPRRPRALTDDERQLWESVAKQAKPLRKRQRAKPVVLPEKEPDAAGKPATASGPTSSSGSPKIARRSDPPLPVMLTRRERSQLSRRRKDIDARSVEISDHSLRRTMEELLETAKEQIRKEAS